MNPLKRYVNLLKRYMNALRLYVDALRHDERFSYGFRIGWQGV
ncbi:hypothetical protein [Salinivibrio socompensis]|nr:hypothetical protein [Salinivibrio socompensis]